MSLWRYRIGHWLMGLFAICAFIFLAALGGLRYWLHAEYGIQLEQYQGVHWHLSGVDCDQVTAQQVYPNKAHTLIQIQRLSLRWVNFFQSPTIRIAKLELTHQRPPQTAAQSLIEQVSLAKLQSWLVNKAPHLSIQSLHLDWPCASGRCQEEGALYWQSLSNGGQQLQWQSHYEHHPVRLEATLQPETEPPYTHQIGLKIFLDEQLRLNAQQHLSLNEAGVQRWAGHLLLEDLPEAPWVLAWINPWLSYDIAHLTRGPVQIHLETHWDLATEQATHMLQGSIQANLRLPTAWPIPDLGLLQGQVELALTGHAGRWQAAQLNSDLTLQLEPEQTEHWPAQMRFGHLRLKVNAEPMESSSEALPLRASVTTQGNLRLNLQWPEMTLKLHPLSLAFKKAQMDLTLPRLTTDQMQWNTLRVQGALDGLWAQGKLQLHWDDSAQIHAKHLQLPQATLGFKQVHVQTGATGISFSTPIPYQKLSDWKLGGALTIEAEQVQHPQLNPLAWRWQGNIALHKTPQQWMAEGQLSNASELSLQTQLVQQPNGRLKVTAACAEPVLFTPRNPLEESLRYWPNTLSVQQGHIHCQGFWSSSPQENAYIDLRLHQLSGQYRTTPWQQLSGRTFIQYRASSGWKLDAQELVLQSFGSGSASVGPLHVTGSYQAPQHHINQGLLHWDNAQLDAWGGRIWFPPNDADFRHPETNIQAQFDGVQLTPFLAANPHWGISGTGQVKGFVNLQSQNGGQSFHMSRGFFAAEQGGILKMLPNPPQGTNALSSNLNAMQQQQLSNFHYTRLSGYLIRPKNEKTLHWNLHLQGRNPQIPTERLLPLNMTIQIPSKNPSEAILHSASPTPPAPEHAAPLDTE